MQVGATPDLMVAYIDFFLGGDEKRLDMVSIIQKRFPMCIIFGGNGSYMSPYNLHSDALLTNLLGQVSWQFLSSFSSFIIHYFLYINITQRYVILSMSQQLFGIDWFLVLMLN